MGDVTLNGMTMEYHVVSFKMDKRLKSKMEAAHPDASEQEKLDAYVELHKAEFGKDFMKF
jgi:hypothetical protein